MRQTLPAVLLAALCCACAPPREPLAAVTSEPLIGDAHSFARPAEARVRHLELDLSVDFDSRRLQGTAVWSVDSSGAGPLRLDTRDLAIEGVWVGEDRRPVPIELGEELAHLGRELVIPIAAGEERVEIAYRTSPAAAAIQWLGPEQTTSRRHPFLFTQSQAILARTWVPCQDTPAVRFTYGATVHAPADLLAVMSAANPTERSPEGVYRFEMPQAIPSYLLALAVGELEFRETGPRSGVYAEPAVADAAAWEFGEVERMIGAAERLYGPYLWGRYDLLILPPSFPLGGMENPRLTFATPTIIAGDRSLVALVAHELAHSWSGNLATNANWNEFWLNEGFTSYIENRIMEELYGADYAEMLRALSLQDLQGEIEGLGAGSPDTHLVLDLAGRDPDDGMTSIAYDKGAALLRRIEESAGRTAWDPVLRAWFDEHAFESVDTEAFLRFLDERLFAAHPGLSEEIDARRWTHGPGMPDNFPVPDPAAFRAVEEELARWLAGAAPESLDTTGWTTHEWIHFLRSLPAGEVPAERWAGLDQAFGLTASGNSEILAAWLEKGIRADYPEAYPALERFLMRVGRRKFLRPLYTELARTEKGRAWALEIYRRARPGYHSISAASIDEILGWESR